MKNFQSIIEYMNKNQEENNWQQKSRRKKEETKTWIKRIVQIVDKSIQPLYKNLEKQETTEQEIKGISYGVSKGIDDTFKEYLENISEALKLGGYSYMYNAYRKLYYDQNELIEIYERIKDERISKKFKISKNIKMNKENIVREVLNNYRKISNNISYEDRIFLTKYKNSPKFRKFVKEQADIENIKDIKEMQKFVGIEKINFMNFFKEQKSQVETNVKQAYVQSIIVIVNILDQLKLLPQYQQGYKKEMENMGLGDLIYEIETQGRELGLKEIFKKENLSKLSVNTLMGLSAFWINRLTKEIETMNNAKFICRDLDLFDEIVKRRIDKNHKKEEIINEEMIADEIEKINFLNIVTEKMIKEIENDLIKYQDNEEITVDSYIKEISAEYQEEYLEYFNKYLPKANNILGNDIEQFIVAKNIINNLYKGKSTINFALMEEAIINGEISNWGWIEENGEKDEKFALIGFDIPKLSGPLFLHMQLDEIKDFLERNKLENKIQIYQGKEDFNIKGKFISRKLLMPIDNEKRKKLEKIEVDRQNENDKVNYIEHCRYIASGDEQKYPKHLKKIKFIGKGKNRKQKLTIQKEYIDLDTRQKYKKDKDGNFKTIDEENRTI